MKAMAKLKKDRPELFETKKEAAQHSPKKPQRVSAYALFTKEYNKKVRSFIESVSASKLIFVLARGWQRQIAF